MKNKTLSIIIPTYNMEGYLAKCLSSLIIGKGQESIEAIVVNDGSIDNSLNIARDFESKGATHIHIVDLEGAKSGITPNLETVKRIVEATSLSAEIGGGIRSTDVIEAYVNAGVDRVILGTAAVADKTFVKEAVDGFGDKIVVGTSEANYVERAK